MAQNLGFGQTDQLGRVIPRLEQQRQQPVQPQAQAGPSMYDTVLQVLQDPRNAWIGMGPMAMAGMAGKLPKLGGAFGWGKDPRTTSAANRLAALDGGYKPLQGQPHYSPTTQDLSSDPVSWANLLDKRWDTYNAALRGGIEDGMTPEQAADAARQLNFRPPGFDQVMQLRNVVTPNYGRLPNDPRQN